MYIASYIAGLNRNERRHQLHIEINLDDILKIITMAFGISSCNYSKPTSNEF